MYRYCRNGPSRIPNIFQKSGKVLFQKVFLLHNITKHIRKTHRRFVPYGWGLHYTLASTKKGQPVYPSRVSPYMCGKSLRLKLHAVESWRIYHDFINFRGPYLCSHAMVTALLKSKECTVVQQGSTSSPVWSVASWRRPFCVLWDGCSVASLSLNASGVWIATAHFVQNHTSVIRRGAVFPLT